MFIGNIKDTLMKQIIVLIFMLLINSINLYGLELEPNELLITEQATVPEETVPTLALPETIEATHNIAQPIKAQPITQATDHMMDAADEEQFLQDLLHIITPEQRTAFEQEVQFPSDELQEQDLSDLNNIPDVAALSDISDEDLIQLIEALSQQPDFESFADTQ